MDTTSDQLSAPYCSSSPPSRWDVFLSFRGKDTRRNFTSHLYNAFDQAGILTFRDDPALEKGEQISPALLEAIKDSKMFVVVLSKNYAYSPWCLDELVEILISCKRRKNHAVIPVFYYVDPSDLRHQKGTFGEALDFHKKRHSVDKINKWRSALAEIAEISGYHLKKDANENESDAIQEIVENVAPQASTKVLHLEKYLFGIDSAVEEIYQKLFMDSNDVRAIVICGMGGIGKTTTAKAFFNKYSNKFDICCFVENVKQQYSQGDSHLLALLKNLLIQLLRRKDYTVPDVETGIRQLEQILCFKKALIVLDDLDQSELLASLCNLFSAGSRIIITTRDANLLNQLKVDISEVDIYMVKKLGKIDSLKLFSYHAFRRSMPPDSFKDLSLKFVTYAGGLPLALKVLGSSLCGRTHVSFWKAKLEKVREIPENKIHKLLQLSYDELGDESEKAIFLDIVFFFIGKDKDEAVHVFKSCDFYPDIGIPILVERCLLTIDDDNKFQMHNLIQDMGREVIREESRHGKCRRLYLCQANAWDDLQNLEGTDKIEALILDLTMWTKRHLGVKLFEKMPNLRLLEIIGANNIKDYEGNFEISFHNLRCIRWPHCPLTYLPSDFCPQQLVSLDMPYSKFKTLWKNTMPLMSLKIINVSYSENLKMTPDFRDIKLVEKLLFRGCKSLLEVHPSIGQLTNLYHLDLSQCYNLKELCEPIGQLTELGHLDLRGCVNMKRLPKSITRWTNLGYLNMSDCRNLKRLPEHLGDMKCLKMLDASYTAIKQLPDSIADLKQLAELNLDGCWKLKKLPEQIGNMEGLSTFDASLTAIEQLPDSFVGLVNLVKLKLSNCWKLTSLPNNIWKLKLLEVLDLGGCSKLERLPEQFGKMECLSTFDAICSGIEQLPDSFVGLVNLATLRLYGCKNLTSLPNRIWKLKLLKVLHLGGCSKLERLPEQLGKMKCLEVLDASGTAIEEIPDSIGLLSSLQELDLGGCRKLEYLPNSIWNFPDATSICLPTGDICRINLPDTVTMMKLEKLNMRCNIRLWLPIISCFSALKELCLTDEGQSFCSTKPFSLCTLASLQVLTLDKCTSLGSSFPELPLGLEQIRVYGYATLEQLPDLFSFKQLWTLYISNCISLQSLPPLPPHLQVLTVEECTSLQHVPDLSTLKLLKRLNFIGCSNLKSVSLKESSLQVLGTSSFEADLPNREIPEWFSYKSSGCTISFNIPTLLGDNFWVALWLVYKINNTDEYDSYIRAVIKNKTEGITNFYRIIDPIRSNTAKVQSRIVCIRGDEISVKSGDIIKVSFQTLLSSNYDESVEVAAGELKVEKCGAHVLRKSTSTPYQYSIYS